MTMLSLIIHPALPKPAAEPVATGLHLSDRPVLAIAYLLAGGLLEVCGPLFWTALVVGFFFAEFSRG